MSDDPTFAEIGRVIGALERAVMRRLDSHDARVTELLDRLADAEKKITRLDNRLKAAERRALAAARVAARPAPVAVMRVK